jgi:hypothetical protein
MRSHRLSYSPGQGGASYQRSVSSRAVRSFKRLLIVLGIAGAIGALARVRGKGGVPPTSGGWRELEGPDFR